MMRSSSWRCLWLGLPFFLFGCATVPEEPAQQVVVRGKPYKLQARSLDQGTTEQEKAAPTAAESPQPLLAEPSGDTQPHKCERWEGEEIFAGCSRRAAKTSLLSLRTYPVKKPFTTVREFRDSLPDDDEMRSLGISKSTSSNRVQKEKVNVSVDAYLIAVKAEADNDYHLILGDDGCADGGCLLNAEISGLPLDCNDCTLKKTKHDFENEFLSGVTLGSRYAFFEEPIPVTVTGSIFFDVDHRGGTVGPAGYRPSSSWEIHPIRSITVR